MSRIGPLDGKYEPGTIVFDYLAGKARIQPDADLPVFADPVTRVRTTRIPLAVARTQPRILERVAAGSGLLTSASAWQVEVTPDMYPRLSFRVHRIIVVFTKGVARFEDAPVQLVLDPWQEVDVHRPHLSLEAWCVHMRVSCCTISCEAADAESTYAEMMRPRRGTDIVVDCMLSQTLIDRLPQGWPDLYAYQHTVRLKGPAASHRSSVVRLLSFLHAELPAAQITSVTRRVDRARHDPAPLAWIRWPFNAERIVAFVLATGGQLPAYVVLWIFDWLPWSRRFTEQCKVEFIQRVTASLRRARRSNQSIP